VPTRAQWLCQARFHRPIISVCLVILIGTAASVRGRSDGQAAAGDAKPPSTAAQTTTHPLPPFRAGANLVRVDVFPTRDGKPVRDLTAADFDVFEDGKPQKVESFEHIEISGQVPQEERREPNTVREARAMAEDPRSRIFIVFLDTYHTEIAGSHRMQTVLEHLLDRIIGPDDLFGVMTPEMSARDITLSRRTEVTEGFLHRYWYWGRRDRLTDERDPVEAMYEACYPENYKPTCKDPRDPTGTKVITEVNTYHNVAQEMIKRRREKRVLDAMQDLSTYLQGLREERKAVIAVSDGWLLFRENQALVSSGDGDQM
jgi:VWFA-related protein